MPSTRISRSLSLQALTLLVLFSMSSSGIIQAADHRDSPRITNNFTSFSNLDILDVYAFQAPNKNNSVVIMTMSTDAGVLSPTFFNPGGIYEFKIVGPDAMTPTATYQIAFSMPNSKLQQSYTVMRLDGAGTKILGRGNTNKAVALKGGGKIQAGLFDDPFFFDLIAFNKFKAAAFAGDPNRADIFLKRSGATPGANIPNNFFGGFNCISIVMEVPSVQLQSSRSNSNIGVWARTVLSDGTQIDRMGRPGINTVLLPDALKDAFNSGSPETDASFRAAASEELRVLFGASESTRTAQVNTLLPDTLTYNTKDKTGFLNGRRPADDVIDAELNLFTGGAVTTDDVGNDSVFRLTFPYLGTPNPKLPIRR